LIVKKLHIYKFRNIENLELPLGAKLTFIAGTNGTSKTSLLGLLGQPFIFRENNKIIHRALSGKEFKAKFSEIHHFTEYDDVESIEYRLNLTENFENKVLEVGGYIRRGEDEPEEGKPRLVTGKTRTKDDGNFHLPVVYLGLRRLCPLGEHDMKDVKINGVDDLYQDSIDFFNREHKKILLNLSEDFVLEKVETPNKKMIGGKNSEYDSHGLSSGQDNVSQILTAILSFKQLKEKIGDEYKGGLLLVDELEATLHPVALEKLIQSLYSYCRDFKLQIIVTTHSTDVLKLGLQPQYRFDTEIIYLTRSRGKLDYLSKACIDEISSDMTATPFKDRKKKYNAVCEDDEAKVFLEVLLDSNLKTRLDIISAQLSGGRLKDIAKSNSFKKITPDTTYFLDGDQKIHRRSTNTILLPGTSSPEALIWEMMNNLPESDPLPWGRTSTFDIN